MASFNKGIRDWFDYALRSVAEEEMARFPSLESSSAGARAPSDSIRKRIGRQQSQKLFWLPHIDLHVVTLHSQDATAPRIGLDLRPEVLCTFSCESVGGPIVVPYTVEPYYSLRAFIMTYQNENAAAMQNLRGNESLSQDPNETTGSSLSDRDPLSGSIESSSGVDASSSTTNGMSSSSTTAESVLKEAASDMTKEDSYNISQKMHDYREFITTLYKTNIQIRTQNFETANFRALDNVLNSEFMIKNQRVTVPKKLQRFLMDPMDATLAQVVEKAIKIMQETASDAHERLN